MLAYWFTIPLLIMLHVEAFSEQRTIRACEPPKYINTLPTFAQEELRTTWKNYKKGEPCESELLITDDILAAVDIFAQSYATSANNNPHAEDSDRTAESLDSLSKIEPFRRQLTTQQGAADSVEIGERQRSALRPALTDDDNFSHTSNDPSPPLADYGDYLDGNSPVNFATKGTTVTPGNPSWISFRSGGDSLIIGDVSGYDHKEVDAYDGINFLKTLGSEVRRAFENMINDPDMPSEGLRREKIHLLAVSLLNPDQLTAYNKYATERRKRARAYHSELAELSNEARKAFGVIARAEPSHQYLVAKNFPAKVRRELRNFAATRARTYH